MKQLFASLFITPVLAYASVIFAYDIPTHQILSEEAVRKTI